MVGSSVHRSRRVAGNGGAVFWRAQQQRSSSAGLSAITVLVGGIGCQSNHRKVVISRRAHMGRDIVMQAAFHILRSRFYDHKGNEDWDLGLFLAVRRYAVYASLCTSGRLPVVQWSVVDRGMSNFPFSIF